MKNLNKKQETKAEKIWMLIFQIIGLIMFIAPLYLPILAYFSTSIESIRLTMSDIGLMVVGIFLVKGKEAIGIVINNIGIIITDTLKRISNTK